MSRKLQNRFLACTAMTAATLTAAPALAQTADSEGGLDIIIVTAQKREQSVQDVPIAVTALGGEALQANRVTDVTDLSSLAPGVTVRTSAGGSQLPSFTIRGAVSYGVVPGSDKQVSMYIDGVYLSSPRGAIFDLPDIARIELLRGPQGTLFGRNATAGAVSITTRDPTGELGVKATGTIGNRDQHRLGLSVDLPQMGPLSGYISYVNSHKRGDIRNLGAGAVWDRSSSQSSFIPAIGVSPKWLGTKDNESWFGALKFESGDFITTYKFDRNDYHGTPEGTGYVGTSLASVEGLIALQGLLGNRIPTALDGKRPKEVWNSFVVPNKSYVEGHSLTSSYQFSDSLSVKNIAAYRTSQLWSTSSLAGLSALLVPDGLGGLIPTTVVSTQAQSRSKQWSDEIQFNYESDLLTATVGGLWFKSKDWTAEFKQPGTAFFGSFPGGVIPNTGYSAPTNKATSLAAYAQLEFHMTEQLDVILGGRITRDKKSGDVVFGDTLATEQPPIEFSYKKTKPNYLIGINYKPTDDILLYGKFSTAFVSGGSVGGVPFKPETAKSVEGGIKAELFDRKLRTNLALYWARYKNFQTSQSARFVIPYLQGIGIPQDIIDTLGTIVVPQGGPVTSKGVEFDFTAAPIDGVTVGGNLGYDKTTFKDVDPLLLAATGGRLIPTLRPHWTGGLWGQIDTVPIIGDAYASFRMDGNYQSRMAMAANPDRAAYAPGIIDESGYVILNGRISLRDLDLGGVKAELAVWSKNMTNERAKTFALEISGVVSGANYVPARTFGMDVTVKY